MEIVARFGVTEFSNGYRKWISLDPGLSVQKVQVSGFSPVLLCYPPFPAVVLRQLPSPEARSRDVTLSGICTQWG